jgi:hypothetical protein
MTLTLIPKNLRKSYTSMDVNLTQRDVQFWMSWTMSEKSGILSSVSNESVDFLSSSTGYTIVTLVL